LLNDLIVFLSIIFSVVIITAFITLRFKKISIRQYVDNNKDSIKSALLAIFVTTILGLAISFLPNNANASNFFNDAGIYLGLDYTKDQSPQCVKDSFDDRGTSNLGVWFNIWESSKENIRVNTRYTHHSCYLGQDDIMYDAIGVQVEWQLWQKQ